MNEETVTSIIEIVLVFPLKSKTQLVMEYKCTCNLYIRQATCAALELMNWTHSSSTQLVHVHVYLLITNDTTIFTNNMVVSFPKVTGHLYPEK